MTEVIAWTYDADIHCDSCARERFGTDERGYVPEDAEDSEGNTPHPIPNWDSAISEDHDFEDGPAIAGCSTCGTIIESIAYEGALLYLHPIATIEDIQQEWREHREETLREEIQAADENERRTQQWLCDFRDWRADFERGISDWTDFDRIINDIQSWMGEF